MICLKVVDNIECFSHVTWNSTGTENIIARHLEYDESIILFKKTEMRKQYYYRFVYVLLSCTLVPEDLFDKFSIKDSKDSRYVHFFPISALLEDITLIF